MHGENLIETITLQGQCRILAPSFMPWNLYLEETDELDGRVNNVTNFYYWCATRVLTLDRKYAKQILSSMGMSQATTDKENQIAEVKEEWFEGRKADFLMFRQRLQQLINKS